MNIRDLPIPTDVADRANAVGRDAARATRGAAHEATAIATDKDASLSAKIEDASVLAGQVADTARGIGADAADIAHAAGRAARAKVHGMADVATERYGRLKADMADGRRACEDYVRANPVRAALYAAAAGAVVTEILLMLLRRSHGPRDGI